MVFLGTRVSDCCSKECRKENRRRWDREASKTEHYQLKAREYRRSAQHLAYEASRIEENRRRARESKRRKLDAKGATPAWQIRVYSAVRWEYEQDAAYWKRLEWSKSDFKPLFPSKVDIEKLRAYARAQMRKPINRIRASLRLRIRKILRGRIKFGRTMELTGCTRDFLVKWIERQWAPGMTWDNYGKRWVIDHRIPCAVFDLTTEAGQRACFHYTNLQPMERWANLEKSDSIVTTQPELPIQLGL